LATSSYFIFAVSLIIGRHRTKAESRELIVGYGQGLRGRSRLDRRATQWTGKAWYGI
jgi:hypothetical protein